MPSKNELKELSKTRLKEVKALYSNDLFDGASYLAGYVIELALKAKVCKHLDITDYLDRGQISNSFKTHKLEDLMILSGLSNKLSLELARNRDFQVNWSLINTWSETFRYRPVGARTKSEIEDLINAIEDPNNGIFTWIKRRW